MKDTFVPNSVRCVQTVKEEWMMSLVKRFAAKNHSLPFKPEVLIAAIFKKYIPHSHWLMLAKPQATVI